MNLSECDEWMRAFRVEQTPWVDAIHDTDYDLDVVYERILDQKSSMLESVRRARCAFALAGCPGR